MKHNVHQQRSSGRLRAVTLRNVPPLVERRIRERAKERGMSLNRAVISLLEESLGASEATAGEILHHDLDHLAGVWTKEEATAFDRALAEQRRIEPDLWK